jgi:DNA-binding CsgD family transcriptional regulator
MLWADETDNKLRTPESIHIDEISFKYGIRYGFSVPAIRYESNVYSGYGCCSLVPSEKEFMDDVYRNINLVVDLIQLFDEHITNKFSSYSILENSNFYDNQIKLLTDKELALLKLLSEGSSYEEISFLLKLKAQSVRSNMRKIRDKLKCKNNQSAIQFYNSIIK